MPLDPRSLKSRLDIVTVLRDRGFQLEPKGENLFMCCPFHPGDDTPSLSVNPEKQLWSCFGCKLGGDVITFIQRIEKVGFQKAMERLARRYHIESAPSAENPAPATPPPPSREDEDLDRPRQEVMNGIVTFWQKSLMRDGNARHYLHQRKLWHPEVLRALRIGYAPGSLPSSLPEDGKLFRQLRKMGILNRNKNEFLYNRIVVPLFDENGAFQTAYGRALKPDSDVPHLYLPGARRSVFNPAGYIEGGTLILTESILDALSLIVLGFTNVSSSFGVMGFTPEIRIRIFEKKISRVYCAYDADDSGDFGAKEVAQKLTPRGVEVLRVKLPCKDPNEFLVQGGTREGFQALLDAAERMGEKPAQPPSPPPTEPAAPAEITKTDIVTLELADRTYRVEGEPTQGPRSLVVLLRVTRQEKTFLDSVNLYDDRGRARWVGRLNTLFRGQVPKKDLEEDLFHLLDKVEEALPSKEEASTEERMNPGDEAEARSFLQRPDLTLAILEDLTALGVVGESDNKLLAYLAATSRKLPKPLSLSVISRASAGKSWLLNRVVDLMPPKEVLRYTRMSPRALFYEEPGKFKHKILFIEEAIGAKDADLGVRSMQSEKRLANLATMTDPKTGQLKTQETVVEGPLTYLTSSVEPLDHETATRSFEISIDESSHQTERIVSSLFRDRTMEGIRARLTHEAIKSRHQNAQSLLEALWVVNDYASQLKFPTDTLRLRREADKYLSLIDSVALLHQHQRPIEIFRHEDRSYRFVRVLPSDIDTANRLMASCLARALSDLPGPAEELLMKVRARVHQQAQEQRVEPTEVSFTRRDVREWVGWSDYQVRLYLKFLLELEYLETAQGAFGKRYVHTLSPEHRLVVQSGLSLAEKIEAMGLTPVNQLVEPSSANLATR